MSKESFTNTAAIQASLKKRYAREKRFQWYGRLAVLTGFVFLFILLADIVGKGAPAFTQQYIKVTVEFDGITQGGLPGCGQEQPARDVSRGQRTPGKAPVVPLDQHWRGV
jgi:phosphate transport system permease protein